ncbi:hypothetical protein [Rhizobium sp. C1]|uniref:hypothetical protein n=1 Tax=Rhizobium sp. C1 TaxID=1349799 RepID=UPI001E3C4C33|nr:hypothetical protein [Rhizobium sp. C1]MCD2176808.1 hypothetical protein [Rhizobium sp. C1]
MRISYVVTSILLALCLTGCDQPSLAVRGDSTALASRSGMAKIWNLRPSWDSKRWWVIVGKSFTPERAVFNDGVGGQSIRALRDKMLADHIHRGLPTVIYDRRNDGEDPVQYVADLKEAVATLTTRDFLILPQVPQSAGYPETPDQMDAMKEIDTQVLALWPENTFSPAERKAFMDALAPDETRIDGLHRNEKGQMIEAEWIGQWLHRRIETGS